MADLIPWISNTNTIGLYVRNQITNESLQSATVTFDLKTTASVSVTSGSMTFDSIRKKRNKDYFLFLGTIAHTVSLSENTLYYLDITLSHDSKQGKWVNLRVKPKKREIRA